MTRDNVEIVLDELRLFEAEDDEWDQRNWHPDSRLTAPEGWPEPGPFEGLAAVGKQVRRLASDMGAHNFRDLKVVADREGWVVVSFLWDVRGAGSGAPFASKMAGAYHLVDGRFKEAHFRWTPEEALGAAGLSE
jgi:hypothetical protein